MYQPSTPRCCLAARLQAYDLEAGVDEDYVAGDAAAQIAMLVQGAHYILGPLGEDSDLRRWECGWRSAEARMQESELLLPLRGSWQCCATSCPGA